MKLRCTTNSIRIRVRKSDLKVLEQEGQLWDRVQFSPQEIFLFGLQIDHESESVIASFEDKKMLLLLPAHTASSWIQSNQVGIEVHMENGADTPLHILIEKDFPCAHRPTEDKADTFTELASSNDAE